MHGRKHELKRFKTCAAKQLSLDIILVLKSSYPTASFFLWMNICILFSQGYLYPYLMQYFLRLRCLPVEAGISRHGKHFNHNFVFIRSLLKMLQVDFGWYFTVRLPVTIISLHRDLDTNAGGVPMFALAGV